MPRHLYIHSPQTVWAGQVNMASIEFPLADITFDNVTVGSDPPTEALAGYTVWFGSTAGADDLGKSYIRRTSIFNNTLLIGYSSQGIHAGEINISDESYITVKAIREVWAKPQRFITNDSEPFVTVFKNYDEIFESNGSGTLFYPKANAGPPRAGTIDGGVLTLDFDASDSFSIPLGVGITSYLWDVGDGTITDGTSADAAITATFPPGFRYVSLTVTDDNDLEHTMYVPVYARDPDNDTCVEVWQADINRSQQGSTASVRVFSDLPRATYPDGSLVMIFDDDDEDHYCQFVGWIQTDPGSLEFVRTGALRDTTLECVDIAYKLDTLPGQSQVVSHAATPANWSEMFQPEMYMLMDYLLRWHSTALEIADFHLPEIDAGYGFAFITREAAAATLYAQVQEQARSICPDHNFCANRAGQLLLRIDPQLQAAISRTSTVQATLNGHIRSIHFVHQRPPRYQWIRGGAIIEGWTPVTGANVEVDYIIKPSAFADVGSTSISVYALPVALPDDAQVYLIGLEGQLLPWFTVDGGAAQGATTIPVDALADTVDVWQEFQYTATETGPDVIPTVFCIAPGLVPSQGSQSMTINNKLAANQGGLNNMIGHLWRRVNSEYGPLDIELSDETLLDIDPAEFTWLQLNAIADQYIPQRLLDMFSDGVRLLPLEMSIRYSHSKTGTVATAQVRAEVETIGQNAVTLSAEEAI